MTYLGKSIIDNFTAQGCRFFTGVPDSVLAGFCEECDRRDSPHKHVVAANEGNAIGLAIGWWLATGEVPVVYMQNSGLSNALNPLLSAAHVGVYSVPIVLLIGWRGMPGFKDEPQHRIKGEITTALAKLCDFDFRIFEDEMSIGKVIGEAVAAAREKLCPTIILVPPGLLPPSKREISVKEALWSRTEAISGLLEHVGGTDALIATTGHIGRDVYGQLRARGRNVDQSLLCVGAMGHASQIAAGVALAQPGRRVWCLDGDGAFLMHLGGAALIGEMKLPNLVHVLFNNGIHGSVGGTPTCAPNMDFRQLANALGYERATQASNLDQLATLEWNNSGCTFIELKISSDEGGQLGRPPEPLRLLASGFQRFCVDSIDTKQEQMVS